MLIRNDAVAAGVGATHALVIGVGSYPLLGPEYGAARELSSAAASAVGFANWLDQGGYANPEYPLGSIELILSPGGAKNPWPGAEAATLANIRDAFDRWFGRAHSSPDNVAIFYFAGHGVWYDKPYLLTEDFDPTHATRPWGGAFSMDATHNGLARCNASYQLCFIEACQTIPHSLLGVPTISVPGLIDRTVQPSSREAPIVYASRPREPAHGLPGEVASFTRALLHVLGGAGANPNLTGSSWEITTADLPRVGEVLRFWADLEVVPDQEPHFEISGGRRLASFSSPPKVDALVRTDPDDLARCTLQMVDPFTAYTLSEAPRTDRTPWQVRVPKGTYQVTASDQDVVRRGPQVAPLFGACPIVVLP